MKNKLIALTIMTLFFNGCNSQVNTSDPQLSQNIKDSQKNGVFIKQFIIENCSDKNIVLEEAWTEKTWFYEIHNGKKIKVQKGGCQLCFKLQQVVGLKYNLQDLSKWLIQYKITNTYVGVGYGIYELSFNDCTIPDKISLDLIERIDTRTNLIHKKVGVLKFRAIESEKLQTK